MPRTISFADHFDAQTYIVKKIFAEFKKPILENKFFQNLYILRENSEYVLFQNNKWERRPHIFCNDYYDQQYYYPIVLLANNIKSIFDFIPDNFYKNIIVAPRKTTIAEVTGL